MKRLEAARPVIKSKIAEVSSAFHSVERRIKRHQEHLRQLDRVGGLLYLVSLEAPADTVSLPGEHDGDLSSVLMVAQKLDGSIAATTDQGLLDDCDNTADAHRAVDLLRGEVEDLETQVEVLENHVLRVSNEGGRIVRTETLYIYSELECFVRESRRFLEARAPVVGHDPVSMVEAYGQIMASATVLAELADFLYSSESIAKRGCDSGRRTMPLERAIDHLTHLDPEDRKAMRKKYREKAEPVRLPRERFGSVSVAAAKGLRMREGPSVSSPVLLGLPNGTRLEILSKSGTWWQVETRDGRIGWVCSRYLKEV